jgi:hypothetical protein
MAERNALLQDPDFQLDLGAASYVDSLRAIQMSPNVIAKITRGLETSAQQAGHPNLAAAIRMQQPVVRVPGNLLGEGLDYSGVGAAYRVMQHVFKDPKLDYTPEQADLILRSFKKGSVGVSMWLLGYYGYQHIGGYYYRDGKKQEVPPGKINVFGKDVPEFAQHTALVTPMLLGATYHHAQDEGVDTAHTAMRMGYGMLENLPMMRETSTVARLSEAAIGKSGTTGAAEVANFIASLTDPMVLRDVAAATDRSADPNSWIGSSTTHRKPDAKEFVPRVLEQLELGVPGLRQRVPTADEAAAASKATRSGSRKSSRFATY